MLAKKWKLISETGISSDLSSAIARPIRLLNRSVLLIVVVSIIFFCLEVAAGEHRFLPYGVGGLMLFVLTYWFTWQKKYVTARIYFACVCWLFVAGMCVLSGERAGTQYFYFAGVIIPFILFNEKRYIFILEAINAAIFALTLLFFAHSDPLIAIDEKTGTEFHYLVIIFNIIIMFLLVLYLKSDQWNYEKRLASKNAEIAEKNKEILDSITYARRIQSAILPPLRLVRERLRRSFILYKPKDIVAGDFFWMETINSPPAKGEYPKGEGVMPPAKGEYPKGEDLRGAILFAAADCTGHGVPGAMVSVVCNNALNRAVREYGLTAPGEILDKARELVIAEFEKSEEEVKDGMDISLIALPQMNEPRQDGQMGRSKGTLQWAGANNPLWIVRGGELLEWKGDKQPIGKTDHPKPFTNHSIEWQEGDNIYLFSDGFADQFGGPKGKKFKYRSFRELLLSIQDQDLDQQRAAIDQKFEEWKGVLEQVDDVCVVGIRLP